MIRNHSRIEKRAAFTLVELMVVILIIAVLVSLLLAGVTSAMRRVPVVQTSTEIRELEVALQAFMADYNLSDPPPSKLVLDEQLQYTAGDPSYIFLTKVFGKNLGTGTSNPNNSSLPWIDWNGDGHVNGPFTLEGERCLVFYLGGMANTQAVKGGSPPAPQGFSTNNMNPAAPGGKRKGPYFNFQTPRLSPQPTHLSGFIGFFVYLDPWQSKSGPLYATLGGSPYAYCSSQGIQNNYSLTTNFNAVPYQILNASWKPTGQYSNPNTYQIISAGRDGVFGNAGWNPTSGVPPVPPSIPNSAGQPAGADDQTNFSAGVLGVGQS